MVTYKLEFSILEINCVLIASDYHLIILDNQVVSCLFVVTFKFVLFFYVSIDATGCSKRNSTLSIFISIHYNIMMSQYRVPW